MAGWDRREELWYSTRPKVSEFGAGTQGAHVRDIRKMQGGIMELVSTFGVLGDAAYKAGMKFEDASQALRALQEQHPKALEQPKECVFCGGEGELVRHEFDTVYMRNLPIWTRICDDCRNEPLCPSHPWGVHDSFVSAEDPDFQLECTVVVDLERLDRCGHCRDCGLPLVIEGLGWRYWTPAERSRLL